jgi:hypothetical protein
MFCLPITAHLIAIDIFVPTMNADLDVTLLGIPKKMRDFLRFRILQVERGDCHRFRA